VGQATGNSTTVKQRTAALVLLSGFRTERPQVRAGRRPLDLDAGIRSADDGAEETDLLCGE
jgi:hypothetical protein